MTYFRMKHGFNPRPLIIFELTKIKKNFTLNRIMIYIYIYNQNDQNTLKFSYSSIRYDIQKY